MIMSLSRGPGKVAINGVADDFERASLGSNWTLYVGNSSTTGIVASSDMGVLAFSGVHIAAWAGPAVGADQFSEARSSTGLVSNMQHQVFARRRTSDGARYALHYNPEAANNIIPASPQWEIKYDGVASAQTRLIATSSLPAPSPGDTLRLEVRGSSTVELKAYHNGILIMTATDTDANRVISGPPGLVFREFVGASITYPSPVWENWSAGTLL